MARKTKAKKEEPDPRDVRIAELESKLGKLLGDGDRLGQMKVLRDRSYTFQSMACVMASILDRNWLQCKPGRGQDDSLLDYLIQGPLCPDVGYDVESIFEVFNYVRAEQLRFELGLESAEDQELDRIQKAPYPESPRYVDQV